jgi:hypothetical protein
MGCVDFCPCGLWTRIMQQSAWTRRGLSVFFFFFFFPFFLEKMSLYSLRQEYASACGRSACRIQLYKKLGTMSHPSTKLPILSG